MRCRSWTARPPKPAALPCPSGAAPDEAVAEGPAVPDGPGAEVPVAPGRSSARACVVSKVTVCENSCRRAPDEPVRELLAGSPQIAGSGPGRRPGPARKTAVLPVPGIPGGSAQNPGSAPGKRRASKGRTGNSWPALFFARCRLSQQTMLSRPAGNSVHHAARKIATLVAHNIIYREAAGIVSNAEATTSSDRTGAGKAEAARCPQSARLSASGRCWNPRSRPPAVPRGRCHQHRRFPPRGPRGGGPAAGGNRRREP